jgi:carbon monoxide dehydrogenase subunit G
MRASVRREVTIARPPDEVWAVVGDPTRLPEWFPGIVSCTVEGDTRSVTTGSGITLPEQLVTIDRLQRRFQYRVTGPIFREHLASIDVLGIDNGTRSVVVYATDADPATMALILGGAAGNALVHLRKLMEGT